MHTDNMKAAAMAYVPEIMYPVEPQVHVCAHMSAIWILSVACH